MAPSATVVVANLHRALLRLVYVSAGEIEYGAEVVLREAGYAVAVVIAGGRVAVAGRRVARARAGVARTRVTRTVAGISPSGAVVTRTLVAVAVFGIRVSRAGRENEYGEQGEDLNGFHKYFLLRNVKWWPLLPCANGWGKCRLLGLWAVNLSLR